MKKAFTLAEVLITLGIIGVVAALTIPTLTANYQKKETVTKLKAAYSMLSQAVLLSSNDNEMLEDWVFANAGWGRDTYDQGKIFYDTYISKYLKIIKTCGYRSSECWADRYTLLDGSIDGYKSAGSNNTYSVVLANGVVLGFWPRSSFGMVEVYVDLNGKKGPNVSGKDVFNMIIVKTTQDSVFGNMQKPGVWFYGQGYDRDHLKTSGYPCSKTGTLAGTYCGALIMYDGWQILDDYPW